MPLNRIKSNQSSKWFDDLPREQLDELRRIDPTFLINIPKKQKPHSKEREQFRVLTRMEGIPAEQMADFRKERENLLLYLRPKSETLLTVLRNKRLKK